MNCWQNLRAGGCSMAKALVIAFSSSDAEGAAAFGQALGAPFDILHFGDAPTDLGAGKMISASGDVPADALADGLKAVASGYSHIAAVSSMHSKDVMARLAGLLDAAMVTDVIAIASPTVFKRPIYAGSIIATIEVLAEPVVITFRPAGFAKPTRGGASTTETASLAGSGSTKRVSVSARASGRPDLTQAKFVVSGGRPLRDAQTFEQVIGGLADKLGAAVGATRAAVDSGIAPNECQVGQTGKIVAPDLYIAAGISGSTQHMAGIKDSKVIVAINKDPDAPIFEVADLGLVADLFDAVPEMTQKL
ncbi:MAG: FAD-binding protein [Armatimonadetes bacterium]|nr:FAD-binding protein [Armatimonadota bacterium]